MAFNIKNILTLIALLGTLWAVVATSDGHNAVFGGTYVVSSDCVTPVREGVVTVANNQVTGGSATSFIDFGFPSAIVTRGNEVAGTIGLVQRVCTPSYQDKDNTIYIYSCFDNGAASCSIVIQ